MSTKWQLRSRRKKTGGLRRHKRKHKRYERARASLHTFIGDNKAAVINMKGGKTKLALMKTKTANVMIDGKAHKAEIKTVTANPADPHFVRRNIITKGATIDTSLGKALVTSRPGQDGIVNAKLIESSKK